MIYPVFSIFLSKILAILLTFSTDPSQARKDADEYSIIIACIGVAGFIFNVLQYSIFTHIGETMTDQIRN